MTRKKNRKKDSSTRTLTSNSYFFLILNRLYFFPLLSLVYLHKSQVNKRNKDRRDTFLSEVNIIPFPLSR